MEILGMALTALGEILIGYAVVRVHWRVMKEHRIDAAVFSAMKREQKYALVGILFILTGFVIELLDVLEVTIF